MHAKFTTTAALTAGALLLPLASASPLLNMAKNAAAAVTRRDDTAKEDLGCSEISLKHFQWQISGFDFHSSFIFTTPAHQNSWGYVNFNLTNPAVGDDVITTCSAASSQLSDFFYGTVPYTCVSASPDAGTTKFDFARSNNQLRLNQTWTCADADPQFPTTFKGYGAVNLVLSCDESNWLNHNWTIGQIYSTRNIDCKPVDLSIEPYQLTAVA